MFQSAAAIDFHKLQRSVTSLPICAAAALSPAVIMAVAEVNGFSKGDSMALCGTMVAIVVVLIAVRQHDKSLKNCVAVLCGTLVFGITSPGLIVSYLANGAPWGNYQFMNWQLWVLLGFIFGLAGWSVTNAMYSFFTKYVPEVVPFVFRRFFGRLFGLSDTEKKPPPPTE